MTQRLILSAIIAAALRGQTAGADDPITRFTRPTERTLTAVLQWEILWTDSPKGFRLPADGSIALAIHAASGTVSYCSHHAGVCATYGTDGDRNWEGSGQAACDDNRTDLDALLSFVGKEPTTRDDPPPEKAHDFTGIPAAGSGVTWTTKITLGSRADIVMKYRLMRPPKLADLEKRLRSETTGDSEVKSITIACFADTDPIVYYYVDRPTQGPVERPTAAPTIIGVFWRLDEPQQWVGAGYSQRWQNPGRFDEIHRIIESITCSTLSFK